MENRGARTGSGRIYKRKPGVKVKKANKMLWGKNRSIVIA